MKPVPRAILTTSLLIGFLAALAAVGWFVLTRPVTVYTDGASIRRDAADGEPRDVLWAAPTILAPVINSGADAYEPCLSTDGRTLYFVRGRAGGGADLYSCERTADGWTTSAPLAAINSPHDDLGPEISPDGLSLYFYSDRPGGAGGYDLWVSRLGERGWSEPVNLGPSINTMHNEYGPALSPDGLRLFFASNRPRPIAPNDFVGPIQPEAFDAAGAAPLAPSPHYDLYSAALYTDGAGAASPVTALNSASDEGAPAIAPHGDFMYFASNRAGGQGGFDLWRARIRADGQFGPAENIGAPLNTPFNELDPSLAMAGFEIFFSSTRPDEEPARGPPSSDAAPSAVGAATLARADEPPIQRIHRAVSREVFPITERRAAHIDFAALWPWLLLLLLALLLSILLAMILARVRRGEGPGRLSLLARCLLASLLVHALLMLALTTWHVTTIIGEPSPPGGVQVSLAPSSSSGAGLFAQIQASLTDVRLEALPAAAIAVLPTRVQPAPMPDAALEAAAATAQADAFAQPSPAEHSPDSQPSESTALAASTDAATPAHETTTTTDLASPTSPAPTATTETRLARSLPVETTLDESTRADAATALPTDSPADAQLTAASAAAPQSDPSAQSPIADAPRAAANTALPTAPSSAATDPPAQSTTLAETAPPAEGAVTAPRTEPAPTLTAQAPASVSPAPLTTPFGATDAPITSAPTAAHSPSPALAPAPSSAVVADSAAPSGVDAPRVASAPQSIALAPSAAAIPDAPPTAQGRAAGEHAPIVTAQSAALPRAALSTPGPHSDSPTAAADSPAPAPAAAPQSAPTAVATALADAAESSADAPSIIAASPEPRAGALSLPDVPAIALRTPSSAAAPTNDPALAEAPSPAPAPALARATPSAASTSAAQRTADATDLNPINPPPATTPLAAATPAPATESIQESPNPAADAPIQNAHGVSMPLPPLALADARLPRSETHHESAERAASTPTPAAATQLARAPLALPDSALDSAADPNHQPPAPAAATSPRAATQPPTPALGESADPAPRQSNPPPAFALLTPDLSPPPTFELPLPADTAPAVPNPYPQREPEQRKTLVERHGGSRETERAVEAALSWLAAHQTPDGGWSGRHFDQHCGQCTGVTSINSDAALTGLAALCFLAADHVHTRPGPYQDNVARAIDDLRRRQSASGDLRDGETMYSHGIATIALAEAFGMTGDERLREPVERAIQFIVSARNETVGGWRYEPGMVGDSSVLGWQVMAMVSARRAGIDVPQEAFDAAAKWLDLVTPPQRPWLYAYQPGMPPTRPMTAESMFVRQLLGVDREDPRMARSADYIIDEPPNWRRDANTYMWYYATLALFQHQGRAWDRWNEAMKSQLLATQRRDGRAAGSWDPADKWSRVGGRVYQTAICTLTLEVYYRYLPLYMAAAPEADRREPVNRAPDEAADPNRGDDLE